MLKHKLFHQSDEHKGKVRKIKRLPALSLVSALVLSFAACNNDAVSTAESAESETKTVELTENAFRVSEYDLNHAVAQGLF